MNARAKRLWSKGIVLGAVAAWGLDLIYRSVKHVSYANRQSCFLYRSLHRPGFLLFEYFVETLIVVIVGIFVGSLLTRWLLRRPFLVPKNPVGAFVYGSLLPICACAAVPMVAALERRIRFRNAVALMLAAPILSPSIIVMSFTVLGVRYGILRIVSSFVLVTLTAYLLELARKRSADLGFSLFRAQCERRCQDRDDDPHIQTLYTMRKLLPFLAVSGCLGVALELSAPGSVVLEAGLDKGIVGVLLAVAVGVPLYFCNGSEILILRPLIEHGVPLGTGIAFSLSGTAICLTSVAMLLKYIGTRLTITLVGLVATTCVSLALFWNWLL